MKMNRKLLTVLAALVILGAAAGCNKKNDAALTETNDKQETTQAKTSDKAAGKESYDYSKILKGDFSEFAGTWVNWRNEKIQISSNGTFRDSGGLKKFDFDVLGTHGECRGSIIFYDENDKVDSSYPNALYPVGVEVVGLKTDTTKVRMCNPNSPSEEDVLYYLGKTVKVDTSTTGDLPEFRGSYANGAGEKRLLRADGTFADGQTASGFTRQNNPKMASGGDFYMWGINADGGGFAVALFPPGVDVMGYEGIIPTDKTKVRLTMGQDLPSSSAEVFYYLER
jgi:hypothetical protein